MRDSTTAGAGTWRPLDEAVALFVSHVDGETRPERIRWRGSDWSVVGPARHWSTWRALPVMPPDDRGTAAVRGQTVEFWRFRAQTAPVGPLLSFEVRCGGHEWRLVRLGATFSVPD